MKTLWQYNENNNIDEVINIQNKYNISKLLASILVNRGIKENVETFLSPTRYDFYNPFQMPDMEKAANRIIKAIENKEKVIIYGDYDVDGVTSLAVLISFLKDRGLLVDYYIPNRLNEGYGLNNQAIEKIASQNYTLMVTVDCGITSVQEIELAKSLGIETIVTDHHEPGEKIPEAIAVVDCKRKDNKYEFRELAGVGVTFKLIQAISIKLNLEEKEYLKYLDIVSIGTVADIVPLIYENRTITSLGLKLIKCTKNIGLKELLKTTNFNLIDSNTIAFGLAPRINACGRMGVAHLALELFLTKDVNRAREIAEQMNVLNSKRQLEEKNIFNEAEVQIRQNNMENDDAIILKGKNWHNRCYWNCIF